MVQKILEQIKLIFKLKKQNKQEIIDVNDIYTPLSEAKEEIWRRWNDKELRRRVEEYLKEEIPVSLKNEPRSILARHLISPNNEFLRFIDLSKLIKLKPICLEYLQDKFRSENEDKYHLAKLHFFESNKDCHELKNVRKIINFESEEGVQISNVKTIEGENFVNFHHKWLLDSFDKECCEYIDVSDWIKNNGKDPRMYYKKFFALFICFGVLFEDYLENKNEKKFTQEVILPNFKSIYNEFGIKPLIVRLHHSSNDHTIHARGYNKNIEKFIKLK